MSVFSNAIAWVKKEVQDIFTTIEPGISYIEKNIAPELIKLAETVLTGFVAGTDWETVIVPALLKQAETDAITVGKGALSAVDEATVALNTAQNNILVQGQAGTTAAAATSTPVTSTAAPATV